VSTSLIPVDEPDPGRQAIARAATASARPADGRPSRPGTSAAAFSPAFAKRTGISRAYISSHGDDRARRLHVNSLNSILLEGNLTRDPESKTLPSGSQVCNFSVATNRFYRQNEVLEKETSYFDVEAWARLGQTCGDTLKKGRGVRVVGRLKQERWLDPEGRNRSKVKIVAEHVEFKPVFKAQGSETEATEAEVEEEETARVRVAEPVF
jgi:single-strand DNA-binding protein